MARNPKSPSRMDVLVLSSLARRPMHGYEIKLELRYKHVRWWAKCDHGHLYASLERLERKAMIEEVADAGSPGGNGAGDRRRRRVFAITPAGSAHLLESLEALGQAADETYFAVDLFLAGSFLLSRERVLELLGVRRDRLRAQLAEAQQLSDHMAGNVPPVAHLIIGHRALHLGREVEFMDQAIAAVTAQPAWGSFLGKEGIQDFVERTGVELET